MNKNIKEIENSLRRFVKKSKNVSYSTTLLVAFLMTGFISYANENNVSLSRGEISEKITLEKSEIDKELLESQKRLREIELKTLKLMRRGGFWTKSLDDSYQFFFTGNWGNFSKNSNRTKENFSGNEYSTVKEGEVLNSRLSIYEGKNYGIQGIMKNRLEFTDSISFGANITPKKVEEKTVIFPEVKFDEIEIKTETPKNVEVEKPETKTESVTYNPKSETPDSITVTIEEREEKKVEAPKEKNIVISAIEVPTAPTVEVTAPTVKVPQEKELSVPNAPTVSVATPSPITPLEKVTVTEVAPLTVTVSTPTVVEPADIATPTVKAPATPAGFEPRKITSPDAPTVTEPTEIQIILPSLPTLSTNPGHYQYDWWNGNDGDTSQTTLVQGKIWKDKNGIYTKNYIAHNTIGNGENELTEPRGGTQGTVTEILGKTTHDKEFKLRDGSQGHTSNRFFLTLLDVPYSYFGKDTKIYSAKGTSIVDLETEGKINVTLEKMRDASRFSENTTENTKIYNTAKKYREMSVAKDKINKGSTLYFNNKGTIELANNVKFLTVTTHTDGEDRVNIVENSGKIIGLNKGKNAIQQYGFYHSPDTREQTSYVYVNSGTMDFHAKDSAGAVFSYNSPSLAQYPDAVFVNDGDINLYGVRSAGIAFNKGGSSSSGTGGNGIRRGTKFIFNKAVNLYGDKTVGLYNLENNLTKANDSFSIFRATIGAKDNKASYTQEKFDGSNETFKADSNLTQDGKKEEWVDTAVGIYNDIDGKLEVSVPQLEIEKYSKQGVGIYAQKGKVVVEDGNLKINGGEDNIGLYAIGGDIDYSGSVTMGGSTLITAGGNKAGKGNIGIYAKENRTVNLNGTLTTYNTDGKTQEGIGVYSKGTVNLNGKVDIKMEAGENNGSTGIFSNGSSSKVNIASGKGSSIEIDGMKNGIATNKGAALYSKAGGQITADGTILDNGLKVKIVGASTAVAAEGTNSKISLKKSTIDYDGNGYAIYSDGKGEVDLSGAKLTLKGKSTAFDLDLAPAINLPIKVDSDTRIKAESDNVIVFNLKNSQNLTTVGGIEKSITDQIKTKLGTSLNLDNLVSSDTNSKYKIGAVDGGSITLGSMDKSGRSTDIEAVKKDGFQFYNRFLGQRLIATTKTGSEIKAILTTDDAKNRYNGQVIALEMNSSKKATLNSEAQINLVSSTVKADRDGIGAGAIGTFINYGKVNIDKKSQILVEKENNAVNDKAVGVYAVNGSVINNKGKVSVGGNESVGILAQAYRVKDNTVVKDEFGGKADEGKITVNNDKDSKIEMVGNDAIGIYAENNNKTSQITDSIITNKGTIIVRNSKDKTAIGIYGDKVTIKPTEGTINIADNAVGIYAKNGTIVGENNKNLGTVNFKGNNGVAVYLDETSTLAGDKITVTNADKNKTGNVGLFVDKATGYTANLEVDTGDSKNIISYYSKNSNLTLDTDAKIGNSGVGIAAGENKTLTLKSGKNIEIGANSTGILGKKNTINLENNSTLKLTKNGATGIYSNPENTETGKTVVVNGKIELADTTENSVGVYGLNGAEINVGTTNSVDFKNSKNNIAYYLAGATLNGSENVTELTSNHENNNIYIYAQASDTKGSTINLKNIVKVNPEGTATDDKKTVGIYLNTARKDKANEYADNTLNLSVTDAKVEATKGAIGIYAKNDSTTNNKNIINSLKISAAGDKTVGIYADGNIELAGANAKIEAKNKAIGLYGNKGKIEITNPVNVELTETGTGIYLTNGTHLDGQKITLENKTADKKAVGVYYAKGTATSQVENKVDLDVTTGNNLLALYADKEINLKNSKNINISGGNKNTATFVTGNSTLTNEGNITLRGNNLDQALGIYVENGTAINSGTITVEDTQNNNLSVGMAGVKKSGATKAEITNNGTINVTGDAIGMYIDDGAKGTNTRTVTAKNSGSMKTTGVYVKGNTTEFDNTSGTISSDNIALALENTEAGKIKSGTLNLTKNGAVGVYAKNSKVDFDVAPTVETGKEKIVALYAEGNTEISKTTTSAGGKGHVGVYVKDSTVQFKDGSKVVVNNGLGADYGVGIYTEKGYSGNIETKIEQKGKETIGIFLGNDNTTGSKVTYTGNISIGEGIGVYVPEHSEFVANGTTFDVDGGTAVFLKGGKTDLGKTGSTTINFGTNGGTVIYQDGGEIETGNQLTINGSGSFLTTKNADSKVNSEFSVGKDAVGINAIYDNKGTKDYKIEVGANGKINLTGNSATGIAATVNGLNNHSVTIENNGEITTNPDSKEVIGIFAKGASVDNKNSITVGEKGIGIYTTNENVNENTKVTNKKISLTGDGAIGILANKAKTTQDFELGNISGNGLSQTGAYFKDSQDTLNVKDFNISVGNAGKGLVFDKIDNSKTFNVTATGANNKVIVGDEEANPTTNKKEKGLGLAAIEANGDIAKTEIKVGKGSLGLYAEKSTLTFTDGKIESSSTDKDSILVYGKEATINLNGSTTLDKTSGIALGITNGEIITDNEKRIEVLENGVGAFIDGSDESKTTSVSKKFKIQVNGANGVGVYAKGKVTEMPEVSVLKGNKSKAYVLEDLKSKFTLASPLNLETTTTEKVGIYAKGTAPGLGIETSGIKLGGDKNIGIYNEVSQEIKNTGSLEVGNSTKDNEAIGIYTKAGNVETSDIITVGQNSIGIFAESGNVNQITAKAVTVGESGTGIVTENGTVTLLGETTVANLGTGVQANGAVSVGSNLKVGNDALGVYTKSGAITLGGKLEVGSSSKGAVTKSGDVTLAQNLTVANEGLGILTENGNITLNGAAEVGEAGTGAQASGTITLANDLTVGKKAAGFISGKNVSVGGNVQVGEEGTGIQAEEEVTLSKNLTVANKGLGVVTKNGAITLSGTATIGEEAVGLETKKGNISVSKDITVANKGLGVYTEDGTIDLDGKLEVGTAAKGAVTKKGNVDLAENLEVKDNAEIGIYAENGAVNLAKSANIGISAVGVQASGAIALGDNLSVAKLGKGLISEDKVTIGGSATIGEAAKGIQAKNDVTITKDLTVDKSGFGVFTENGKVKVDGKVEVAESATGAVTKKGNIDLSKDLLVESKGLGLYTESGNINLGGKLTVGKEAKGGITKKGNIILAEDLLVESKGLGLLAESGNITLKGSATVKESAIGAQATKGSISLSKDLLVENLGKGLISGDEVSVAGNVDIKANGQGILAKKDVKVGKALKVATEGLGILTETGKVEVTKEVSVEKDGIGIEITKSGSIKIGENLTVASGKKTLGVYTESGDINLEGKLTVGKEAKGGITKKGNIILAKDLLVESKGLGLLAESGDITLQESATVKESAIGVQATKGSINLAKNLTVSEDGLGLISGKDVTVGESVVVATNGKGIQAKEKVKVGKDLTVSKDGLGIVTENGAVTVGGKVELSENAKGIEVINSGAIKVGKDLIVGNKALGAYTKSGDIDLDGKLTVSKEAKGGLTKKGNITLAKDLSVESKGLGLYTEDGKVDVTGNVLVEKDKAIGVYGKQGDITLEGNLSVDSGESKGIFSEEKGNILVKGNIDVKEKSIAIYKKGTGIEKIETIAGKNITVANSAYGILSNSAEVLNNADLIVGKDDSVGIYTKDANLTSKGTVTVDENSVGLFLENTNSSSAILNNVGNIDVKNGKAIGISADNANIETSGVITVGKDNSVGVYSKGSGNINTKGKINVENDSIGIYKEGEGILNLGQMNDSMKLADKSYGVYFKGEKNKNNKIISNFDINMKNAKEAVGVYAQNSEIYQKGKIIVGKTTIGQKGDTIGYDDPELNKNSIGLFGKNSDITYEGDMIVDSPLSVGIYGQGGGNITFKSGTMTVKNGAYGIMTGKGVESVVIAKNAKLAVSGKAEDVDPKAKDSKVVSTGIAAFSGEIENKGTIEISNGATGIFLGGKASLKNQGKIKIGIGGGRAVHEISPQTTGNLGGLTINKTGKVVINDKIINGGTIEVEGKEVEMKNMQLDISKVIKENLQPVPGDSKIDTAIIKKQVDKDGKVEIINEEDSKKLVIAAGKITGKAVIIPNFSKGNSEQKYTIKNVFRTNPKVLGSFSGDIESKSVSWIAKISADSLGTKDITMARIPYTGLITGEKYKNLASGLERVRLNVPKNKEVEVFKSLDGITNHEDFALAIANIRGDIYSNVQERMKTVENSFEKSYGELLDSYNVTKDVNKFSLIFNKGRHSDSTLGVNGYKYDTTGLLYLNDREAFSYGGKYGWSAGISETHFDFDDKTNKGSREHVTAGKLGLHYQKALNREDNDAQLKYITRAEIGVNRHRTKRNTLINTDAYKNSATYYSTDIAWKNKVFYDYDINTKWTLKPYASLDVSYGHIWNIKESGEEALKLKVKAKDYSLVTPSLGAETKYLIPLENEKQIILKADAKVSYDLRKLYNGNKAKLNGDLNENDKKGVETSYYELSKPERNKLNGAVGIEIGLEKTNNYGIMFRAEYNGNRKKDTNYSVRLNYKF